MKTRSNNSKPILFSGPMVRAILEGRKTQTRRVVKPQPNEDGLADDALPADPYGYAWRGSDGSERQCPYGQPGDLLWVRETFQFVKQGSDCQRRTFVITCPFKSTASAWIEYAATPRDSEPPPRWKPSIYMPRWASRLTLEVVSVRVERLQDISDADARAEGVEASPDPVGGAFSGPFGLSHLPFASSYANLWESINGPGSWSLNPWVWVVEFKQVSSDSKRAA